MKVILTGATGMVGEGVLFECLQNDTITEVLIIGRRHYATDAPKVKELLVKDFSQMDDHLSLMSGYDACFYCAGVSSVGMNEQDYSKATYDLTLSFAQSLLGVNPAMTFIYVSGSRTDSSEKGKVMWARVKGKTENALHNLGFKAEYNFRPALMKASKGQRNVKTIYRVLLPVFNIFMYRTTLTLQEVGRAMIHAVSHGYPKNVLETEDIRKLVQ